MERSTSLSAFPRIGQRLCRSTTLALQTGTMEWRPFVLCAFMPACEMSASDLDEDVMCVVVSVGDFEEQHKPSYCFVAA